MRRRLARLGRSALALLAAAGCAAPGLPGPWREPGFHPSAVKRPAVLLRVSVDQVGLGSGPFSEAERASLPERYESALQEALNALGILPVDVTLEARRQARSGERPLEGLDRARALARAGETGGEHLLVVDARLGRGRLVHCRDSGRPLAGTTTYWEAGLEVLRVRDGAALLSEPPAAERLVVDVELDCERGRLVRRKGMDEMVEESASRVLAPLSRP